jgi:N-acetylglucosamine-6-sulfatase
MDYLMLIVMLATSAWAATSRPNIVLIVTDDLDLVLGGMQPLAFTQQLVGNRGATFVNAFTSSPICCPARASILSGHYAHNHRTFNNSEIGGCYGAYWRKVVEPTTFPKRLQENGYRTFYAGKYLNEYKAKELPPGWSEWAGLRGNSRYRDFVLNENGRVVTYGGDSYLTDVLTNKTNDFLLRTSTPFFAMVAVSIRREIFRHKH